MNCSVDVRYLIVTLNEPVNSQITVRITIQERLIKGTYYLEYFVIILFNSGKEIQDNSLLKSKVKISSEMDNSNFKTDQYNNP